ncbi:ATP-dependent DNA helicase PIF1 [Abortiporus biennis]
MPKAAKAKCYAVRNGREGPKIYNTWEEAKINVARYPGAIHKSFPLSQIKEAETWVNLEPATQRTYTQARPISRNLSAASIASSNATSTTGSTSDTYEDAIDFEDELDSMPFQLSQDKNPHIVKPEPGPSRLPAVDAAPPVVNAPPPQDIKLSKEQRDVLEMVKSGRNVFFTGSAGTGKSVLLREIIKHCLEQKRRLAITASTGIASVNIGGCTVHSWSGIGLGKEAKEVLVCKLIGKPKWIEEKKRRQWAADHHVPYKADPYEPDWLGGAAMDRWIKTKTLIVDEISMIDGVLFDKLEFIARIIRRSDEPFGGLQLVLSGDFCQLPPVPDKHGDLENSQVFAFEANTWDRCVGRPVFLTKVFRQKDQAFVDMLNAMRFGLLAPATVVKFKGLSRPVVYEDGIEPTDLFPTRKEVDNANSERLSKLPPPVHTYQSQDVPGHDERGNRIKIQTMRTLLSRLVAPEKLVLKERAQVMLIKNIVQGSLVNGSVGIVIGFCTCREAVQEGTQIAQVDNHKNKEKQVETKKEPTIPEEFMRANRVWPKVRFQNGSTLLCIPSTFEVNNSDSSIAALRQQVPLILAWALSIHKSQGQTLERVRVNLRTTFEKGQAYVALSRATSMNTLQVLDFDPVRVMAHERVLTWMREQTGESFLIQDDVDDELELWGDV